MSMSRTSMPTTRGPKRPARKSSESFKTRPTDLASTVCLTRKDSYGASALSTPTPWRSHENLDHSLVTCLFHWFDRLFVDPRQVRPPHLPSGKSPSANRWPGEISARPGDCQQHTFPAALSLHSRIVVRRLSTASA